MLALCSMLYPTNDAKNSAGLMGAGLMLTLELCHLKPKGFPEAHPEEAYVFIKNHAFYFDSILLE